MTQPLLERGFTATVVDESADMLERVRGAAHLRTASADGGCADPAGGRGLPHECAALSVFAGENVAAPLILIVPP